MCDYSVYDNVSCRIYLSWLVGIVGEYCLASDILWLSPYSLVYEIWIECSSTLAIVGSRLQILGVKGLSRIFRLLSYTYRGIQISLKA